ncbi:MAG TPA: hypothetical protein VM327_05560 [Candidatus Thermoplasmatota archaeon]|nr:hypothetical protein [Candidatus Thermoplasmatota archaeon]
MTDHRGTVPLADWPTLREARQKAIRKDWSRHRSHTYFLADHYPTIWEKVRYCRLDYKPKEETSEPGYVKAVPTYVCEQIPYCIQCTKANTQRRVWNTLNKFALATPAGKPLRLIHIVQTAPIYKDGTGWGVKASQDHHRFGEVVWDSLVEHFGTGIGAYMSYQDFGEHGFLKRHPHKDLTLNGWCLKEDRPARTPYLDLTGKGRARWDATVQRHAMDFVHDAEKGSFYISRPFDGVPAYYKVLAYQMREMIDFRHKLTYDRKNQLMRTLDYRKNTWYAMPVDFFLDGMVEYQMRLGVWTRRHMKQLHTSHGHLSKKLMQETQRKFDGETIPHTTDCPCGECGDWHTVFLDDPGRSYGDVRPLDFESDD